MKEVLVLGSKEYPFGSNSGDDIIPSGGMETYIDDLASELSKLCRLKIVTRKFKGTEPHEKKGNIEVLRVRWLKGKWFRNISFNICSFFRSLSVTGSVDIIYSNGLVSGFFGMLLGKIFRKPTIYRPAGIGFWHYRLLKYPFLLFERIVFGRSSAVLFHSEAEKRNAEKIFSMKKTFVILTGFPVEKYAKGKDNLREKFGMGKSKVITSISRFVPVKGLDNLIDACSVLKDDFRLLMVGSGPEESRLKGIVEKKGMSKKVIFTGFRRDIPDILASTDVFVVSSLHEGLPTSLLEAMAAGKACVVTDIGLPLKHMENGIVVKPGSCDELRKGIEKILKDRRLREKLGASARKFVEKNCTQKKAAESHMKMFREVLG